jgi:hypothetical protein
MIIRILGEGQYDVDDHYLDELNALDDRLLTAVQAGDGAGFGQELRALLAAVRRLGRPVPNDALTPSDLVVPDEDTDLAQVRSLLRDDGLIPG